MKHSKALLLFLFFIITSCGPRLIISEKIEDLEQKHLADPNDVVACYNVGLAHLSKKHYDEALGYFKQCIIKSPEFSLAHFAIYCTEYRMDKKLYDASVAEEPDSTMQARIDSVQQHLTTAFLYDPFFDWKVATVLLEARGSTIDPLMKVLYELLYDGFEAFFLGHYQKAVEKLSYSIENLPSFHQARYFRGLAYAQTKEYDAAIIDFNTLIDSVDSYNKKKILPVYLKTTDLYYLLGHAHFQNNEPEKARTAFQNILMQDMSYYMAHVQLARIYQSKKDYGNAIRELDAAIFTKPNDPLLYYNKGVYFSSIGKFEPSIAEYNQAIKFNPYDYKAHYNVAYIHEHLKQYDQAIKSYEEFMRLTPKREAATIQKAQAKIVELKAKGGTVE